MDGGAFVFKEGDVAEPAQASALRGFRLDQEYVVLAPGRGLLHLGEPCEGTLATVRGGDTVLRTILFPRADFFFNYNKNCRTVKRHLGSFWLKVQVSR